jgi:hypothetical protein
MKSLGMGVLAAILALNAGNAMGQEKGWTPGEWAACRDGSVMIRALKNEVGWTGAEKRFLLVQATCEGVRLAFPYLPKDDTRVKEAVAAVEKAARGKESSVRAARNAYDDLIRAVPYMNAPKGVPIRLLTSTYIAAGYAAAAAIIDESENAVEAAAYSIECAANAVETASRNPDDRARVLAKCADIVRKYFPEPPAVI